MPFQRPSLQTLIERGQADIEGRLPGTDPRLRFSLLNILSHMQAGAVHTLHGYLEWSSRQMIPSTAEAEFIERWANVWDQYRASAVATIGNVVFTGTDTSVIPIGTTVQRSDGVEYTTDSEVVIAAGAATVSVTATIAGACGNTQPASKLALTSPIGGVNSTATVDSAGLTGGADIENDASLLSRIIARIQTPPHGGSPSDYINWALEYAGVTRAWSYPLEDGNGTVKVRFMMDDIYANGIPLAGDVSAVQAYLDPLAPAVAQVTVVAPTPLALTMTIALNPNTTVVQQAVEAEIKELLRSTSSPGGTVLLSKLNEAVSLASGEIDHVISVPSTDVTHTINQIPVLGVITWLAL